MTGERVIGAESVCPGRASATPWQAVTASPGRCPAGRKPLQSRDVGATAGQAVAATGAGEVLHSTAITRPVRLGSLVFSAAAASIRPPFREAV